MEDKNVSPDEQGDERAMSSLTTGTWIVATEEELEEAEEDSEWSGWLTLEKGDGGAEGGPSLFFLRDLKNDFIVRRTREQSGWKSLIPGDYIDGSLEAAQAIKRSICVCPDTELDAEMRGRLESQDFEADPVPDFTCHFWVTSLLPSYRRSLPANRLYLRFRRSKQTPFGLTYWVFSTPREIIIVMIIRVVVKR
jgi:hypothetical protein